MIGQASANVKSDTKRVSPAPRRAKENVTLIESAREYTATHKSKLGTIAATAAKLAASLFPRKVDTRAPGKSTYTAATLHM